MAKRRVNKIDKIPRTKPLSKSSVNTLIIILLIIVLGIIIVKAIMNKDVLFSACPGYIDTDSKTAGYDGDGVPGIKYDTNCKPIQGDNCPTIYNPNQNNKYCNPLYGKTITDQDGDYIPTTSTYSTALALYITDIEPYVYTDIKTKPVRVQTTSTGTSTDKLLTLTQLYTLSQQGTSTSPSPSPSSTSSPAP